MKLRSERVRFQLSEEGQKALARLLPSQFTGLVVQEDVLGFWISTQLSKSEFANSNPHDATGKAVPVMLLKKEYIATAELDVDADTIADLIGEEPPMRVQLVPRNPRRE